MKTMISTLIQLTLAAGISAGTVAPAFAGDTATQQAQASDQVLQAMASQMTSTLNEIEQLLKQEQIGAALALAKNTLDTVRVKTGIDPKARLQQSIYVPAIFPAGSTNMSNLNTDVKEAVIETVRDFRGGLYLDIMNLSKRTSLLYVKALHAQIKKDGGVTSEDRTKIVKDLTSACVVPIYVTDKKGTKIVVFDEDVANEDHTYMFNREIKMYLLNAKDLQFNEDAFLKYKNEYKAYLGGQASSQGATRASSQCIAYVSDLVWGRTNDLGTSVFEKVNQICNQEPALMSHRACVDDYSVKVWGRSTDVGFKIAQDAIKYCK